MLLAVAVYGAGGCGRSTPAPVRVSAVAQQESNEAQFDRLWERFQAVYPSFGYKGVDWRAQRAAYRTRALRARSQDELIAVVREMLAPLRDLHVWFIDPRGEVVPTYRPTKVANFDRARWERAMREAGVAYRGSSTVEGVIGGYPYLFIGTWNAPTDVATLDAALARAHEAAGLILDVRSNGGGTDATALAMLSRFTTQPLVASYVQVRNGPAVADVNQPEARRVLPRGPWQFTKPVVVIAGRAGFSATESFVAAMRTLPNVIVIGDTTGGASGNPATFPLGNGWQFTVPRWIEYGPDHQPIEGRGVAPQMAIPWSPMRWDGGRDPLIDAAVGLLGELNGVYRVAPDPDAAPRGTRSLSPDSAATSSRNATPNSKLDTIARSKHLLPRPR
jgi:hypothetical protein